MSLFKQLGYPTEAAEISRPLQRDATSEYAAWIFDEGSSSGVIDFGATIGDHRRGRARRMALRARPRDRPPCRGARGARWRSGVGCQCSRLDPVHGIFGNAVELGWLASNPARDVETVKAAPTESMFLNCMQVERFVEAARSVGGQLSDSVMAELMASAREKSSRFGPRTSISMLGA